MRTLSAYVKQSREPLYFAARITGTPWQFAAVLFLSSGIVGVLMARAGF